VIQPQAAIAERHPFGWLVSARLPHLRDVANESCNEARELPSQSARGRRSVRQRFGSRDAIGPDVLRRGSGV
jgi:hypothetical protein